MMKRMVIPLVVAAGLFGSAAYATTTQEQIVAELRDQGFTRIQISRTLLGRTRIVAEGPEVEREIILNPASGEILRDLLKQVRTDGARGVPAHAGGRDGGSGARSDKSSGGASNSGRDSSDDRDDDDNSDSGSSGSGGGSSDDSHDDSHDDDSHDESDSSDSGSDDSSSDDESDDHEDDN